MFLLIQLKTTRKLSKSPGRIKYFIELHHFYNFIETIFIRFDGAHVIKYNSETTQLSLCCVGSMQQLPRPFACFASFLSEEISLMATIALASSFFRSLFFSSGLVTMALSLLSKIGKRKRNNRNQYGVFVGVFFFFFFVVYMRVFSSILFLPDELLISDRFVIGCYVFNREIKRASIAKTFFETILRGCG